MNIKKPRTSKSAENKLKPNKLQVARNVLNEGTSMRKGSSLRSDVNKFNGWIDRIHFHRVDAICQWQMLSQEPNNAMATVSTSAERTG